MGSHWTITPARHFHFPCLYYFYRLNRRVKRGEHEEEEEKSIGAAASFSLFKVSQAAINLGLDCLTQKNYYAKL